MMPTKRTPPFVKRIRFRTTRDARVLSGEVLEKLGQIRSAYRENRRAGSLILFSGPQGTGKTMAAEILAHELNLDLYRVDLQAVVSKYIAETEKNLAEVFDAAEKEHCVFFFDEGDALFGKRSEVKDPRDRYLNSETSLILRRMDAYGGICIIAGKFERQMDSEFINHFRHHVHFADPGIKEGRASY